MSLIIKQQNQNNKLIKLKNFNKLFRTLVLILNYKLPILIILYSVCKNSLSFKFLERVII